MEEIIGKPAKEISFYDELTEMLRYIENIEPVLNPLDREPLFRRMAQHYASLAQLDGIRSDCRKMAEYFEERANKTREKNSAILRIYPLTKPEN